MSVGEALRRASEQHAAGDYASAERTCRQLLETAPDSPPVLHVLGALLSEQGRLREAVPILKRAVEADPDNAQYVVTLGRVFEQTGRPDLALDLFDRAVQREPGSADAQLLYGLSLRRADRHEEAESALRRAVELAPDLLEAHEALGIVLLELGRPEDAAATFEQALQRAPDRPDLHVGLGNALLTMRRVTDAISSYRRALQIDPDLPEAHTQLGQALRAPPQANRPKPTGSPTAKVQPAPQTAAQHVALGRAAASRRDARGAVRHYRRALELDPDLTEVYFDLGSALEHLGRTIDAVNIYNEGLQRDPNDIYIKWKVQLLNMRHVARWHYPMLNDVERNQLYDQAIRNRVQAGSVVLDIGAGTGLLSMMAARAGAAHVYACEMVTVMAEVAQRVVAANGLSDKITVLPMKSTDIVVGVHIPRRADLLISELLGAGLLGEGHYESIQHAAEHLLIPGSPMVPLSARVMGRLIESQEIVDLDRVFTAADFDVSEFNRFSLPGYAPRRLPSYDYMPLTERFDIVEFDLTDRELSDEDWTLNVTTTSRGTVQAIAYWFDMSLDEHTHISNGPHQQASHWVQAVQLLPERKVTEGEELTIVARHNTVNMVFSWD